MTQVAMGKVRNESREELLAIFRDCITLLEDECILDRPYELDAVRASTAFGLEIANNLAGKLPRAHAPLFGGLPVILVEGYTGPPMLVNESGFYPLAD